ncbi:cell division protein FtsX [Acetobacter tropicalis NRIC 0312]|uniref:Cell division protein n=1 Tax=Acetobacter tropicalis TaxID=104102 RepID=A0A511FMJ3_9PROT|nr:cell division protein FtsX [Acetobacter tropicalis]KXV47954.1 cell division protein FtsX [Acetobacter tropicalis]GAL98059.1 cell division protein FtsX [Acetobacter tropicalis]GBR67645.1 cell division protein FtsX [Acetobacter tropicalis NRIC 0312]GEL50174.1 cell division protein [Acetobacter tropicalis]
MALPFSGRKDGLSLSEALPDRSLFILVAMMSFLAALTLTGATGARALSARWAGGAAQLLTIQVSAPDQPAPATATPPQKTATGPTPATSPQTQTRADAVLAHLSALPSGTQVHRLSKEELAHLLTPWLGDASNSALPLPAVIEVRLPAGAAAPADLEQTLNAQVPDTLVEHNAEWSTRLRALADSLLACAALALATVGGIAAMITGLATRTGLSTRRDIIEILHGLGATDSYIAGRFAGRTGGLALGGGILGTLLAIAPLVFLFRMAAPFAVSSLQTASTAMPDWRSLPGMLPQDLLIGLAGLPFVAAFIGWMTTQIMVRIWLRRMP